MTKFANLFSPRTAQRLLLIVSLGFAASYLYVGGARVVYPYDLDFIEDAMFMQAWRLAQHQPVFVPANADFVPQVYMPLYTWLGGWLLRLTGVAMWPLRLISWLSAWGTAVLLYLIARHIQTNRVIALNCAALFLAGYRLTGGWYELARVDALFGLLVLAGMATAVYHHQTHLGLALAGIILALALLTKQNGLLIAIVVGVYLLWQQPRRVWIYVLAFVVAAVPPLLYLEETTAGWFSYYVVDIAYASPVELGRIWPILRREFLGGMGLLVGMVAITAVLQVRRDWRHCTPSPWLIFVATAVFVSLAGRSSVGGNLNNLMLGFCLLCLSPALLAAEVGQMNWFHTIGQWLLGTAVLSQFILLYFPPLPYAPQQFLPTPEMQTQGDALVAYLATVDGDVLVMLHPYYALLAGKKPGVHIQSLWHARQRGQEPLPPDLVARIEQQQYQLIISDESLYFETEPALLNLLNQYYHSEPMDMALSPPTLSGVVVRPLLIYKPKP
ncbi:MAG: glycosyltransferase family 39 protein [Ardenticatenaceae bacterium]|nr:glycosyltransferase family 39 protein [Ardenticatenaceae bacterium]